jgi:hypothetical protein
MTWLPRSFAGSEFVACVTVFAAIALAELWLAPPERRVRISIKPNHVIPTVVQVALISYWSIYWAPAWALPRIPLEILFAFGLDYLLDRVRGKTWMAGIGPAPIVLSSNLFIRFGDERFDGILVIVLLAILSKKFLLRNGRHIFNPSAFGLAAFGVAFHLWPWRLDYIDVAHELNLAPNMTEVIFGLGLIVALRIPVVAVTAGAVIGLDVWNDLPGSVITPWPFWPPMLLVFTFLATDPMTIPRTGPGRLLFGLAVGFGTGMASNILVAAALPDYFGKILAVPVCNLLTPLMDMAGRIPLTQRILSPRLNPAHVALWVALFVSTYSAERKNGAFERALHARQQTPLIVIREGVVECPHNPIFCERFTLMDELRAWAERR